MPWQGISCSYGLLAIDDDRQLMPFSVRVVDRLAKGLAFPRAVDATEADTFRMGVVQDFDGITVEDRDNGADEVGQGRTNRPEHQEDREKCGHRPLQVGFLDLLQCRSQRMAISRTATTCVIPKYSRPKHFGKKARNTRLAQPFRQLPLNTSAIWWARLESLQVLARWGQNRVR